MLRTSAARLLAASTRRAPLPARALSTTAPAFIRIKKADGTTTMPDSGKPSTPSTPPASSPPPASEQPSPAPKPADAPKAEPAAAPKAEPAAAPKAESAEPAPSAAPEEPKAATASAAEAVSAAEETVPETPDLSKLPSLDIDPEATAKAAAAIEQPKEKETKGGKKKGGARKRQEYVSSQDERRRTMARLGYASLVVGGIAMFWYVGSKDDGKEDQRSLMDKFKGNFTELSDMFSKPAFTKLLPDPLPPPHQRPYTLLVDLEDLLVHSSWDREHGWRTAKRPGVDYFLMYLSQFYEIVLFSHSPSYAAAPIAEKLDPFGNLLPAKLFREATRYVDGHVVKDLTYLNRDLSKVVMLDTKAEHASLQPENAIIIKPWDGKPGDKGLVEMIPFLESIGIYAPADVRPVLQNYAGKDIPREYAKVEAAAKEAAIREWEARNPVATGGNWLSGIFGGGATARPKQPMTYLELKRAEAQRHYEAEAKFFRDNHDEFMKMVEEDKKRQQAELKTSFMGMFGGGSGPTPEQQAGQAQGQPQQQQQQQVQPAAKA